MKALVIGATGATGSDLVGVLIADSECERVCCFVRKASGKTHPKLQEIITNFERPQEVAEFMNGDTLFCCLGTTLKAAGSKAKQQHIDLEVPSSFAAIAKQNGVTGMVLLSSHGASASGRFFYSRLKGLLENNIRNLAFDQYIIFRPGLLLRKNTDRPGEKFAAGFLRFFNSMGILKKFRPLSTRLLAEKMAKAPKIFGKGERIVALDTIFKL